MLLFPLHDVVSKSLVTAVDVFGMMLPGPSLNDLLASQWTKRSTGM